jgi:hypothetical protein
VGDKGQVIRWQSGTGSADILAYHSGPVGVDAATTGVKTELASYEIRVRGRIAENAWLSEV